MADAARVEALEALFDFVWNQMETFDSDHPDFAFLSYADQSKLDELCVAVEHAEAAS